MKWPHLSTLLACPTFPEYAIPQNVKVLFVCLGNICRSPLAEALFRESAEREGVQVEVDSAGTGSWHLGAPADERSRATAARRGLVLSHRARQVRATDFEDFDYLIAMDQDNFLHLKKLAANEAQRKKVHLFREWDPAGTGDVPDPYYGTEEDFEMVAHLCERSAQGLLAELRNRN